MPNYIVTSLFSVVGPPLSNNRIIL